VITVVLLGKLADLAGAPALQLAAPLDWAGLLADKAALAAGAGDEIALLPPVSGG
jgi:molybdopterin synthase sulfur carrier subunit